MVYQTFITDRTAVNPLAVCKAPRFLSDLLARNKSLCRGRILSMLKRLLTERSLMPIYVNVGPMNTKSSQATIGYSFIAPYYLTLSLNDTLSLQNSEQEGHRCY